MAALALAVSLCISLLPTAALAADGDFVIENGVLTKYNGSGGKVTIPAGVTSIGDGVFAQCISLTAVSIPNGVTSIGGGAFSGCKYLTDVSIPDSVTAIGGFAFYDCKSLTGVTIPGGITDIERYTFGNCAGITSVSIPDGVASIGESAFSNCTSLTGVTIPDSVTKLGDYAFTGCVNLKSVTIPDNVTSIGYGAFSYSTAMRANTGSYAEKYARANDVAFVSTGVEAAKPKAPEVPPTNPVGEDTFTIKNGILVGYSIRCGMSGKDIKDIDLNEIGRNRHVVIPDTVTIIGENAFMNVRVDDADSLTSYSSTCPTSIVIPDGVTIIGDNAFKDCKTLTSITIPDSVTTIGNQAFENCIGLTSITLPSSLTTIGRWAFYNCDYITSVTIPKTVTSFGPYAFTDSDNITDVVIQDGVKTIGEGAFSGCNALESVTIPNSVTSIGAQAFLVQNLKSITIPESVTSIGASAIDSKTTIMGKPGTAAEAYAKANPAYYTFVAIDGTASPAADRPSPWAQAQVDAAIAANIVPAALQGQYTQATTRAEFCALAVALYETVKGAEITGRQTFNDTVDVNVEKAAAIGVVSGVGGGSFAPGNKLTREQAATMLSRLAAAVGKPLAPQAPTFADNAAISSWAFDAVGQVQSAGIMDGVGGNTFAPADDYTREQSILTMNRLYEIVT